MFVARMTNGARIEFKLELMDDAFFSLLLFVLCDAIARLSHMQQQLMQHSRHLDALTSTIKCKLKTILQ